MTFTTIKLWLWQILTGSRLKAVLMEGDNLLKAGRNLDALEMYREVVSEWPSRPEGYEGMGKAYQALGLRPEAHREMAIADALITLETDPDNMPAKVSLARALHEKGMNGWAATYIDQAMQAAPRDKTILELAAQVFRANQNYGKASEALRRIIAQDPLNKENYEKLARCLRALNQGTEAIKFLYVSKALEAVEKNPSDLEAVEQAVRHFITAGSKKAALSLLDRCIAGAPDQGGIHRLRGEMLMLERYYEEAMEALRQAVNLDPTDLKAHRLLSKLYQVEGKPQLARQHQDLAEAMEKARRGGDPVATQAVMVRLLLETGKEQMARDRIALIKEKFPRDWRGPYLEGLVLKSEKRTRDALKAFHEARRFNVNAPDPHMEIARIHSELGDMIGAVAEARQAVALSPREPEVRRALAQILRSHGYMDQAIEEEELAESLSKRSNGNENGD